MHRLDERLLLRGPLSVALVGPLPPPGGGMANQTEQLARLLQASGIAVRTVRVNAPYRPRWVASVPRLRAAFRLGPYLAALWRAVGRVELVHVMANSGWSWHLFAAPAVWIARLRGKPAIVNYRGGEAEAFLGHQSKWILPTLARASTVVVPSGFLAAIFGKHGIDTEIVPNVVDLSRFAPAVSRTPARHFIVTRNLEEIYDVATALRAFALIRAACADARLTIAGDGAERPALEALIRELQLGESVTLSGRLTNAEVAELYRDADVLLNPSLVDNMPISLLEAMASGVPIVSTGVGGIPYLVANEETALLVPARDPGQMAQAALRLLREPALVLRLKANGISCAKRYSWGEVRERLLDVYARALGRPFEERQA